MLIKLAIIWLVGSQLVFWLFFKDRQVDMDGKVWKACVKPGEDNES